MLHSLINYDGTVQINGHAITPDNFDFNELSGEVTIKLSPKGLECDNDYIIQVYEPKNEPTQVRIKVKQYMTKPSTPMFDFMSKWNNDVPMPLRVMVGEVDKETPGMVHMKLHGDITDKVTTCCMKCGKTITNPVSQLFGMGPECGQHNYVNPFDSDSELEAAVESYRKEYLQNITWEGWVIKSAILETEVIK